MIDNPQQDAPSFRLRAIPPVALAACALIAVTASFAASASAAPAQKVEVCHIPPGNPDNFHTITISENALAAHLAHGDIAEPCNAICDELCSDNNACTIDHRGNCDENGCLPLDQRPSVDCNDDEECTVDSCDPILGKCVYVADVGRSCGDGVVCTFHCNEDSECEADDTECCEDDTGCEATYCNGNYCGIDNKCDSTGDPCIDDIECTVDMCFDDTGCENEPMDELCDDEVECTVDSCDPVMGCESTPDDSLCDDGIACTINDFCDPVTGCESTPDDSLCDDSNPCTQDGCDSATGCQYTPVVCDQGDSCNRPIGCFPGQGGCVYDPIRCDDNNPCTADSCDPVTGCAHEPIPGCGSTCVNALDYRGSGSTAALINACEQDGNCADVRQCRASSSDLFGCAVLGDRVACDSVNNFWETAGGCTICSPEEPEPSACPCWNGGSQSVPGVSNLTELWQAYGPNTCVTDDCRDYASPDGVVLSSGADCYSSANDMYTRALSNTIQGLANCTVYVRDPAVNLQVVFPIGSPEAEACLAEHDAFTSTTEFPPVPPGGADADTMCGLGSL